MARRPQGTQCYVGALADATVKANPGILYSLHISTDGASAGDVIAIQDGTNGTNMVRIILPTGDNNFSVNLPAVGIQFGTSIYYNPQLSGGTCSVTIGFD